MIDKNRFAKIDNIVSIGGDGEEKIETSVLDEPIIYAENEEDKKILEESFER